MNIQKIYVIAALHGDEPFGLKVLAQLREFNDDRIIRQVGHPEAVAKRKMYIETDLNRCFGRDCEPSKEAKIAQHLIEDIAKHNPDLIIDIHTCECKVGKSTIIPKYSKELIKISKLLKMDYVFVGVPQLIRLCLIGRYPRKAIIIELGQGRRSDALAESIAKRIVDLLQPEKVKNVSGKVPVYSASQFIKTRDAVDLEMENYVFNKALGGYPYLVGKNTYSKYYDYTGFLAKKVEKL